MMGKTHLAFGLFVGLLAADILHPQNKILFMVILLFASILPDIDVPDLMIGRKIKPLSSLFEHRGFFHGIIAAILFSGLAFILLKSQIYFYAVLVGYLSHIFIDALTPKGVMVLHPLSRRRISGFIATGTIVDFVIFLLFAMLGAVKLIGI